MANWETGKGDFGLKIAYKDGDVERAWFTSRSDRDKTFKRMKTEENVKSIDKIKR
jgi:hypothetical protein